MTITVNKMIANYHTHTFRCHHATETERDYIELAIERGLKVLGFSDHVPMPFPDGHESRFRVWKCDLEDYIRTLEALRWEYRDRIEILIGFEAEYYPALFKDMLSLIGQYDYDYLIMGQHYVGNEIGSYNPTPTEKATKLERYVDQVLEGLSTGRFTYLAHPDLLNYTPDDDIYRMHMTRLARGCLELDVPLEINCLGIEQARSYPCDRFWSIVSEIGNIAVIGSDAHHLYQVADPVITAKAEELAHRYGITLLDTVEIRNPKNKIL